MDMYRSNDIVQFSQDYIYVRPFAKVGAPCDSIKIYKYSLKNERDMDQE